MPDDRRFVQGSTMYLDNTIWENTTFIPANGAPLEELRQAVAKKREIDLIAFCLKLQASEPALLAETGFTDRFEFLKNSEAEIRKSLVDSPVFVAWFRELGRVESNRALLRTKLTDFGRVIEAALGKKEDVPTLIINSRPVYLERFDVDPAIAELAAPEYRLPEKSRQEEFLREVEYPESHFRSVIEIALNRIRRAMPEAYDRFPDFVRIIVDMIDGEHTSYSSADHAGAIFVSTDNSPLVAMEEFLIHEFGHQILYQVMELDPIVDPVDDRLFVLPWSGNKREFYGYFHAFYIYVFMAVFLERIRFRSGREQKRIRLRRAHVLKGLEEAAATFESLRSFTARGQLLFDNLCLKIEVLRKNFEKE